jgi:DNA polymerase-3 subunit gamma/tau
VLATTEAHKLPETIISRTQRFSFKPITNSDIITHLAKIAAAEGINVDQPALELVATASRGGFRDAISMLDQLAGSGTSPISAETVRALLGYSSAAEIEALARAIATSNAQAALGITARLEAAGAQPGQVSVQLTEFWRSVLLTAAGATTSADPAVTELAAGFPAHRAAEIVEALLEVSRSHWPQLSLEATLVKLTTSAPSATKRIEPAAPKATARPDTSSGGTRATTATPSSEAKSQVPEDSSVAMGASPATGTLQSDLWPKVLVLLKAKNNSLCALLQMYPVDFADGEVTIKPRFNFHRDLFLKPANRTIIETAAAKVYGRPVKVNARTEETTPKARRPKSDPTSELVSSALEILGGEIVE